jgi:hypothetical protein
MRIFSLFWLCPLLLAQDQPQMVWEGQVDGVIVLRVHGNRIDIEERQGLPVQRQRFRFFERLPDSRQNARLAVVEGRGHARILEQPRLENNYTLSVVIEDPQGGSSFYSLAFYWESGGRFFGPAAPGPASRAERGGSLTWSGRVDGRIRVIVAGSRARVEVINGAPVASERADFARSLPARDNPNATVRRLRGRGRVEIVEYPSRRNGYRLIFEINDSSGGGDHYEVEVGW